ncbi:hypothetical protein LRS37_04405 [Neobacillus sedimentimangrovi]|jgi:hypothetical protein|uniref:Sodium:proton antiporter n=2 Tax=Neobacillus TaxID=2675232 RepID=A0A6B3TUI9_9BACI|nr:MULTISPECIES: hypothetical protein [Neobacillus]AIM15605.1 hypothetical protein HW35_04255 [Bacillus sp. X1(2014)]MCD4838123.1 hypothetical protein [Neobacillus sedimentimangrovi]MED3625509.1 hypothetical protein [Neobacillus thermocopriae]MED3715553.1 hypothetical protein [Neobacillus thermocopriae]NEX79671.1 hypothetical protein [Neobacillus thermocopriae]
MSRILTTIMMIGSIVYLVFRYRYRLLNLLLASVWMRRLAVSSVMKFPVIRRKMMQSVFGGPSEW